ncbi:MAG: Crp/Fnr family transcriptional regulator [Terracidiphilus sp.]
MPLDPSALVAAPELVLALLEQSTVLECGGDRVLFRQGETANGLYILQSGEVTLSMESPAGNPILSIQASMGSLLGLPAIVAGHPYSLTAVAQAGAQVGFVARDRFTGFMQDCPDMAFKIIQVLAAEVSAAHRAIAA